jgi:DNA-binding transcriptional ArsR family regulator
VSVVQQMSLSPDKREILETMLLRDKPAAATQIAKETGKKFPSVMMHLIGLTRMGYANSPEKGQYVIAEKGKEALGIPKISKEAATAILAQQPHEKAFHFYACIGNPLDCYAYSLQDFRDKILKVNVDSIEFHVNHGDFEAWFTGLGDAELARKTALLKEKKMAGEELRMRLHEMIEERCNALSKMGADAAPSG